MWEMFHYMYKIYFYILLQSCTEMVMPMCSNERDMFEPKPWNYTDYSEKCYQQWGVRPRGLDTPILEYGGKNLRYYSNIVFSNGLLDPWSAGAYWKTSLIRSWQFWYRKGHTIWISEGATCEILILFDRQGLYTRMQFADGCLNFTQSSIVITGRNDHISVIINCDKIYILQ